MKFIRDIINEKTQAAAGSDPNGLRFPLKLRAEDRADLVPEGDPADRAFKTNDGANPASVSAEDAPHRELEQAGTEMSDTPEDRGFDPFAQDETDELEVGPEAGIDLSAITGAITAANPEAAKGRYPDDEDETDNRETHMRDEAVASIAREPSIFDAFDDGIDEDDAMKADDVENGQDKDFDFLGFDEEDESAPGDGEEIHDETAFDDEEEFADGDGFDDAPVAETASEDVIQPAPQSQQPQVRSEPAPIAMTAEAMLRRNILREEISAAPEAHHQPEQPAPSEQPIAMNPTRPEPTTRGPEMRLQSDPVAEPARQATATVSVPKPASGRGSGRSGRVKTRLLGFSATQSSVQDPISASRNPGATEYSEFPVGWIVVVEGPGKGAAFTLFDGLTQIGRGEGQAVRLDFGDNSISRENHAAIAFDAEQGRFFFGHGGKANLVRLNGRPVLSTEDLQSGSEIRIGETTLRFIALCNDGFSWAAEDREDMRHAQHG